MLIAGIDTSTIPDQFDNAVPGRTLIIDGDGPCYVAAATVKRLDTALSRFQQEVLKRMFMAGASSCNIHLTAHNSDKHGRFRVKAWKPYQGNRDSKTKPALLEPLRELVANNGTWLPEYSVKLHRQLEADDGMIQDAYALRGNGVISSEDKDLRMTPYLYYDLNTGIVKKAEPEGYVALAYTPAGSPKMVGQGPIFFWGQMLMGDGADHIRGVDKLNGKNCGPDTAVAALAGVSTQSEAANFVIDAYRAINQNVLAEGWLLWLTRYDGDNVIKYINECGLSAANQDFVQDCLQRDWVIPRGTNVRDS